METDSQERAPCEDKGRNWSDEATSQEDERGKDRSFPGVFGGNVAPLTP